MRLYLKKGRRGHSDYSFEYRAFFNPELVSGAYLFDNLGRKRYVEIERNKGMDDIVSKLNEFFKGRDGIILAFLFGSAAAGRANEESDVDIAVLTGGDFSSSSFIELRSSLSGILSKEVDVAILNDASPILKMQVLQKGVLLKGGKTPAFPVFYAKSLKEYEDLKFFRREAEKNILTGGAHG
jgi:uncharacterized protein